MAENVVTAVLQNERQEIQTLVQQMRVWFLVCGSIRRKIENVNDIDVVAIEKNNYEFDEPTLDLTIKKLHNGNDKPMLGDKIKRFSSNEISIDLYLANEATFETLVLIRTGSEDHNY